MSRAFKEAVLESLSAVHDTGSNWYKKEYVRRKKYLRALSVLPTEINQTVLCKTKKEGSSISEI